MNKTITVADKDIPLSLTHATVIHANKYSEASGGGFDFPVSSTLYTDVVFRIQETNEDIRAYIQDLNLPVYNGQEVMLLTVNKMVLGFVDRQTNYYYYTTRDFAGKLRMGFKFYWVFIIGIIGGHLSLLSFS